MSAMNQQMTNTRKYFGSRVIQRQAQNTVPCFAFYARAKDIIKWAGIRRVGETDEGTQRILRETRMKAITRFLGADPQNMIPNSILLAFEPGRSKFKSFDLTNASSNDHDFLNDCDGQIDWGFLEFSFEDHYQDHEKPALIVDGQHRLYGISNFEEEDIPLLVVSLIEAPLQEQAFQFVVINNKSVRVPTDNVRTIIARIDEDQLQSRLLSAGVSYGKASPMLRDINDLPESPFRNLLDWPYNKTDNKLVPLTAVEQSIRYIRAEFKALKLDDDESSTTEIFCAIWRSTKESFPSLWGNDNKFMKKVNITAMNEFLVDRIKFSWELGYIDIFDSKAIERQVLNIVEMLEDDFWEVEWTIKVQDNANVRNLIKEDLTNLVNNSKLKNPWYEDLKLPNIASNT